MEPEPTKVVWKGWDRYKKPFPRPVARPLGHIGAGIQPRSLQGDFDEAVRNSDQPASQSTSSSDTEEGETQQVNAETKPDSESESSESTESEAGEVKESSSNTSPDEVALQEEEAQAGSSDPEASVKSGGMVKEDDEKDTDDDVEGKEKHKTEEQKVEESRVAKESDDEETSDSSSERRVQVMIALKNNKIWRM